VVTACLGYAATRLQTNASADLLMDTSSPLAADQIHFADTFGADPVVVMAEPARGQQLLTPDHLVGMAQLEGELARVHGVHRVYGPGTLVNTFATVVTERALDLCGAEGKQAQQQAETAARAQGQSSSQQQSAGQSAFDAAVQACAQQLAAEYPNLSVPALNNPAFYDDLLLEPSGSVRPWWRSVLPSPNRALISVRMDPTASLADVEAIEHRVTVAERGPKTETVTATNGQKVQVPTTAGNLSGLRLTVSGTPVLMASLAESVLASLRLLLPLALAAMLALTGLILLRLPHRLLAVPLAALAATWTAGVAPLLRLALTPATLAVLPVVLGLTTDYVLQAVNRLAEEEGTASDRVWATARVILPATGSAAAATAAGVLAFALSPVPLVRQFGFFLALGVAMSWLVALLVGLPLLQLLARRPPGTAPSWRLLALPVRIPAPLTVTLALLGLAGWVALPWIQVQADPTRLLPPDSPALRQAEQVYRGVGSAGELDLVVVGPDVSRPQVVAWMGVTEQRVGGHGLEVVSGLPDFLLAFNDGKPPDPKATALILDRLPAYFTQAVVSSDHHTGLVTFGETRIISVGQDQALVRRLQAAAAHPPKGYRAYPAGLAVIAASALSRLTEDQVVLNLLALGLVLSTLLVALRKPVVALVAALPAAVAAGWVSGIAYLSHTQSNPITILLSGVVVAFATEFSVLWLARYRSERAAGKGPEEATETACSRIGPAIVAAAAALVAAFGVLAVSPVPMVRGFGLWCAGDLALASVAALTLLPGAARRLIR
jgi:predicted RND superfamily exporter protein